MKKSTVICIFLCAVLTSCVQKTYKQEVRFEVDARHLNEIQSIGVRGGLPPLSWNEDFLLSDPNKDSVFTGTITLDLPYDYVEVKFVKNGSEYELNGLPNRKLYFDPSKVTIFSAQFDRTDK